MADLLKTQIKSQCLCLPEGLKELMSDISREVLRAQPTDIYDFIANYLSAMLVTRDNLTVASKICYNVCDCEKIELIRELGVVGLSRHEAQQAQEVIFNYLNENNDEVEEADLMENLLRNTSIEADMVPAVLQTIRSVCISNVYTPRKNPTEDAQDSISKAAMHTLKIYEDLNPTEGEFNRMAEKIKISYRAFGVTREDSPKVSDDSEAEAQEEEKESMSTSSDSIFSTNIKREMELTISMYENRINTVQSASLDVLPTLGYSSMHEIDVEMKHEDDVENVEREHGVINYSTAKLSIIMEDDKSQPKYKKISFQEDKKVEQVKQFDVIIETSELSVTGIEADINSGNTDLDELITDTENQLRTTNLDIEQRSDSLQNHEEYPEVTPLDIPSDVLNGENGVVTTNETVHGDDNSANFSVKQ